LTWLLELVHSVSLVDITIIAQLYNLLPFHIEILKCSQFFSHFFQMFHPNKQQKSKKNENDVENEEE
jgi:hypothetical protein